MRTREFLLCNLRRTGLVENDVPVQKNYLKIALRRYEGLTMAFPGDDDGKTRKFTDGFGDAAVRAWRRGRRVTVILLLVTCLPVERTLNRGLSSNSARR